MSALASGLYRLDYPAGDGSGAMLSAIVALNGELFIGSDLHGAMLSGEVRFDAERRSSRLRLRIGMASDGELVTGLKAADTVGAVEMEAELPEAVGDRVVVADIAGTSLAVHVSYVGPLPGADPNKRKRKSRHDRAAPHSPRHHHGCSRHPR